MSIVKIIRHFEGLGRSPVQIPDVFKQIQSVVLDEKVEIHGYDRHFSKLRGLHYRYYKPAHPNSALMPERVAVAAYSLEQPNDWQRLVCCKELVHIFDREPIKTSSKVEVIRLGHHVGGNIKFDNVDDNNIQSFFDEVAKYQALAILFPFGMREDILATGVTLDQTLFHKVAAQVEVPVEYVQMVLGDVWPLMHTNIHAVG
ncbi:hypothetical protein [Agrobacterium pusense]|uniref:hypothetical protein n=1 Tax=Agrobacterium pusense TaxID=648995 RepID=UPI00345EC855